MNAEKMKQQLITFYSDTFAKSLKVRKAKKNVILYMTKPERKVIARFDIGFSGPSTNETTVNLAMRMADACKDAVIGHLIDAEMAKLDDAKEQIEVVVPPLDQPAIVVTGSPSKVSFVQAQARAEADREQHVSASLEQVTEQKLEKPKDPLSLFLGQ